MEERMPPGKAEVRHLHRNVRQLYFVSGGTGTVCFGDREELLSPRDAVDVAPGQAHKLRNDSGAPLGGVEARYAMNRKGWPSATQPARPSLASSFGTEQRS